MPIDGSIIQFRDQLNQLNGNAKVYPLTYQNAVLGEDNQPLQTYITEYNVSQHHTNTVGNRESNPNYDTSVFTLSDAIATVPDDYKRGGLKLSFNSDNGSVESYILDSSVWKDSAGYWKRFDANKLTELESDLVTIENAIQDINGDNLYISDSKGNVIAKISKQGIESVDVTNKDGKKLSEMPNDILEEFYKKQLYISDANGNVVLNIDEGGNLHYIGDDIFVLNDWKDKVIATYGDSVTAVNNGDFTYPYSFNSVADSENWGNRVAQYFRMSNHYGRGIGGTKYMWAGHGGSLCLVETATGIAKDRYDNYTYDDYLADNTIITIPSGQIAVRGCGCSWLRITSMFPESIKDNVDIVTIMFHNDSADNANASFIKGSVVDLEWSQSDYYTDYGGDYNIETFRGAIASLIMKMQAWMPNAVLVLMSPISGQGTANRFKAYFNTLPQVSVYDIYSPDNNSMRMTVTAITDTEDEKSITFGTFEYAHELPVGATSLIKISGASGSTSTLNFTSLSDKNLDGTLININLQIPDNDNLYNQINIVDTMSQKLSIPFINIFHNCGINGFNKRFYIADTIHPYSEAGSKMIARAVIGGIKSIIPNFK